MKRKLVAGLLAVVLTLGTLTGCGSSEGAKGETAPAAEGSADAAEAETADTAEAENAQSASGEREKVVFWKRGARCGGGIQPGYYRLCEFRAGRVDYRHGGSGRI